jgi:hypothetical protein
MPFDPHEFAALAGRSLVGWWPTGTVDEESVLSYYARLASFPLETHRYCDFSAVSGFSFGYKGMEKLVRARKSILPAVEVKLIFMSDNALGYGMSRMYEALMSGLDMSIHVVRSVEEAAELLGVGVDELARPVSEGV